MRRLLALGAAGLVLALAAPSCQPAPTRPPKPTTTTCSTASGIPHEDSPPGFCYA